MSESGWASAGAALGELFRLYALFLMVGCLGIHVSIAYLHSRLDWRGLQGVFESQLSWYTAC